jgi:hypothetical protein
MTQLGYDSAPALQESAAAGQQIAEVDSLLSSGQVEQAHDLTSVIRQNLQRVARGQRQSLAASAPFESNPLATSFSTLAEYAALEQALESMRPGENLLAGGDFEDLSVLTQLGWQHVENPVLNVQTAAQLSPIEAQHGAYCLELNALADAANDRHAMGSNLVWIISPAIPVDQNEIVEISGWVRVERPFADGDGLEIVDSLAGPALALVVRQTAGWQPFRMIRAASEPSQLRLTFSLIGPGAAKIDAVMIRTLRQPIAQRLPPAGPAGLPAASNTAGTAAPGLAAPAPQ